MAGPPVSLTAYDCDGPIPPALADGLAGGLVGRDQPRGPILDLPAAPHPRADGAHEQGEGEREEDAGHRAREHGQGLVPGAGCFDCGGHAGGQR